MQRVAAGAATDAAVGVTVTIITAGLDHPLVATITEVMDCTDWWRRSL
ncbi:MAG: hypothetical protein JXA67_14520 [Micromonosporaceae bacterium]|nr:hypothetical protein [Micromonosporaceae bacterium]